MTADYVFRYGHNCPRCGAYQVSFFTRRDETKGAFCASCHLQGDASPNDGKES